MTPSPTPSQMFGRFQLGPVIGRGSMGIVHQAIQVDLGRKVALKLLPCSALDDPARIDAFRDEARTAARVRHPGLVQVHDAGVADGQPFLAMEYVEGHGLDEALEDGPFAPREAAGLIVEVARAVHALHQHGIVHRDLKPSNVLIDEDGRARVTDFGLALVKAGGDPSGPHLPTGTPGFMAPEQIRTEVGAIGPRSDVWALGSLLFHLVSGRGPIAGSTAVELVVSTIERTPRALRDARPDATAELDAIAAHCLERDPAQRYESAAALADDLERFLSDDAIRAPVPGLGRRLLNTARRRPALTAHVLATTSLWIVAAIDHLVLGVTNAAFFLPTTALSAVVLIGSAILDRAARARRAWAEPAWVVLDAAVLGGIAALGDGSSSAAVQALPLLIAGSGLWRRERIVALATASAMLTYAALAVAAERNGPQSGRPLASDIMALATQLLIGVVVLRLVRHARLVSDLVTRRRSRS